MVSTAGTAIVRDVHSISLKPQVSSLTPFFRKSAHVAFLQPTLGERLFLATSRDLLPTVMIRAQKLPIALFLGLCLAGQASASSDVRAGSTQDRTLFTSAMVASGVDDQDSITDYRRLWNAQCKHLPASELLAIRDRAQLIHQFLHQEILTGEYQLNATLLDNTLDSGDYNCLSSAILFRSLAAQHGLEVEIMEIPGHVFCRMKDDRDCVIETTCPNWFEVMHDQDAKSAAQQHLPAEARQHASPPTPLRHAQILARIYYNRGVSALADENYAEALAHTRRCLQIDPSYTLARQNELAGLNNWALLLCREESFAGAVEKLAELRRCDETFPQLAANELYIYQQWTLRQCREGKFESAVALLARGRELQPGASLFVNGPVGVYGRWANAEFAAGRTETGLKVLSRVRKEYPSSTAVSQQEIEAIHTATERLRKRGDVAKARKLLEAGLKWHPHSRLLNSDYRQVLETLERRPSFDRRSNVT